MARGIKKANVAGERYDSNARQLPNMPNDEQMMMQQTQQAYQIPSKNTQISFTSAPDVDTSRWKVLYPNYLNSKKSIPEGRRIAREHACEEPQVMEISEVLKYLKIDHVVEPYKAYPRDWLVLGRVRIQLQEPSDIHSAKALMRKLGELIPKLQSRQLRLAREAEAALARASSPSTTTVNKKKGKKKGRR